MARGLLKEPDLESLTQRIKREESVYKFHVELKVPSSRTIRSLRRKHVGKEIEANDPS
jgi:hypothetical protein